MSSEITLNPWHNRKLCSQPLFLGDFESLTEPPTLADFGGNRRAMRYAMQSEARLILAKWMTRTNSETGEIHKRYDYKQDFRVCRCHRLVVPKRGDDGRFVFDSSVDVLMSDYGKAHYGNLETCSSVWVCPVCAAKISERRRAELQHVVDSVDYLPIMLTFTLRHSLGDDFGSLRQGLLDAWRQFRANDWKRIKAFFGWHADVRVVEVTHGSNGWHPHIHCLAFFKQGHNPQSLELMEHYMKRRWQHVVRLKGFDCTLEHGCVMDSEARTVAEYIAKFGYEPQESNQGWGVAEELSKSTSKTAHWKGSTPWELLLRSMSGDGYARHLFKVYAEVTKGKQQMAWSQSPDIRSEVDMQILTDRELSEQSEEDAFIYSTISAPDWRMVIALNRVPLVLHAAEEAYKNSDINIYLGFMSAVKRDFKALRGNIVDVS